jgi:molybdopterin converting factor subunit 1
MTMQVRLFASFRQDVGAGRVEVTLEDSPRVRDLLAALRAQYPALGPGLASAMVAVNLEYVGPDYRLHEDDEVAIIPPVSGGGGA